MKKSEKTSRRDFIKLAATTILITESTGKVLAANQARPAIDQTLRAGRSSKVSANDKIRIATIGMGGQGTDDTNSALQTPGVELVAVADVYDGRLIRAKEVYGNELFTSRDYREILTRPDVDTVIVATPDHWHAQVAVDAMNAGKHVYVEKPMVQSIEDGYRLVDAQRKTNRLLQVGSQRVSSILYQKAKELYAGGAIGELNLVEAWWNRNSPIGAWQYSIPPDASPQNIDWDRFLGKAPKVPFEPVRLFRWRNYRDYGTGVAGDLFVHLFSGLHYIIRANGPTRLMASGGLRYWKDGRDVPDIMLGLFEYPKTANHPEFTLSLKVNFEDGMGENSGFRFVGHEGVMTVGSTVTVSRKSRTKEPGYTINTFPKTVQEAFLKEYRAKYPEDKKRLNPTAEETFVAPQGYRDAVDHFANFFNAMRSGGPVVEDAVFGLRAAGPALLSNRSYFENREIGWNPETMRVADRILS